MDNSNPESNAKSTLSGSTPSTPNSKRSTPTPNTPVQYWRNIKRQAPPSPLIGGTSKSTPNSPALRKDRILGTNPSGINNNINETQIHPISSIDNLKYTGSAPPSPSLSINRPAYNLTEFNKTNSPVEIEKTTSEKFRKFKPDFSKKAWIRHIKSIFPIFVWLPQYDVKKNLMADVLVGITIASFQVPQSMGYALIANVNPVFGLYTAFFPALMYTILGTSKHCAVGPVAIVAGLMTGNIVIGVMTDLNMNYKDKQGIGGLKAINSNLSNNSSIPEGYEDITNIDIAIMVAFINGVYIFLFGCARLGFISNYLSEELVSGFMTSAAIYVFTTQLHYLFGIDLTMKGGPLDLIKTYIDFFGMIKETNLAALTVSLICIAILLIFKLFVEKLLHKFNIKMPFPIHLFIMIGGILVSSLMDLDANYQVHVVGDIPEIFAKPSFPKFKLFKYMWMRCIPTALVAYTISLSIGKMYGSKHSYKVHPNQEMIALGASNLWGSIFSCIPSAASIPRSQVQESGGGRTQVVSVVNCLCILIVILALSKLLHNLPSCVLAACISMALVSIISKFQEFIKFWRISKIDGGIWIVTFLGVVILNVDYGLYIGFGCSLLLLIYKSQRPKTYSLGSVDNSDIYVPLSKFRRAKEIEGVKIYQFCGPLNFANIEYFKKELQIRSGVDVTAIKAKMDALTPHPSCFIFMSSKSLKMDDISLENKDILPTHVIIDCSMLSYIDTTGVTTLKQTVQKHEEIGIVTLLTGCQVHIETMLKKDGFFEKVSSDRVYKSVHDAVTYIKEGYSNLLPNGTHGINGSNVVPNPYSPKLDSDSNKLSKNNVSKNPMNENSNRKFQFFQNRKKGNLSRTSSDSTSSDSLP